MNVQTYLYFNGQCEEAIRTYQEAFEAELLFMQRVAEVPHLADSDRENQVFHATLRIGTSLISLSDDPSSGHQGFALVVHCDSLVDLERAIASLVKGGELLMPEQPTPWAAHYAIVRDAFGVTWKLQVN
ncbi:MAG: VOC family protein [Fimbriimonas sp.]